jgi:acetyltransferase-like isoleucine patch superfamily enzyme
VLADCTVGACVIVGANSVVLRGTTVPDSTLIKAASLFRGDRDKD